MIRWSTTIVVVVLAAVAAVVSYRHALEVVAAHGESGWVAYLVPFTIDGLIFASSMVLLDAARRGATRPKLAYFTMGLGILATLAANVMHGWENGAIGSIVAAWPAVALVLSYELLMGLVRRSAQVNPTNPAVTPADLREVPDVVEPANLRSNLTEVEENRSNLTVSDLAESVTSVTPVEVSAVAAKGEESTPISEPAPAPTPSGYVPEPLPEDLAAQAASRFLADVITGDVPGVRTIKAELNIGQDKAQQVRAYLAALANQ